MTHFIVDSFRRWHAWTVALGYVLAVSAAVGCSGLFGPSAETRYVLTSIAGAALPAPFFVTRLADGSVWSLEMLDSQLTLLPDDRFEWTSSAQRKLNGEVIEALEGRVSGSVERRGQEFVLRFQSPGGYEERFPYEYLEGGRQLAGIHETGAIYRWLREDVVR